MSNDLISRSEALKIIKDIAYSMELSTFECKLYGMIYEGVKEIPTAYDVEAVRERTKDIGHNFCISIDCSGECEDCEHRVMMSAIDGVVRNGGEK